MGKAVTLLTPAIAQHCLKQVVDCITAGRTLCVACAGCQVCHPLFDSLHTPQTDRRPPGELPVPFSLGPGADRARS